MRHWPRPIFHPDWIAGISIGAINGALIAGNAPEARVDRLRAFWERHHDQPILRLERALVADERRFHTPVATPNEPLQHPHRWRVWVFHAAIFGTMAASKRNHGGHRAYDANCLKATLEQLIDFDRINTSPMRLSIGAVIGDRDEYASISMSKQRPRG